MRLHNELSRRAGKEEQAMSENVKEIIRILWPGVVGGIIGYLIVRWVMP